MPETLNEVGTGAPPVTHRPWGWFATLCQAPGYLVKRIHVHAGGQLSLQRHRHRAEHWVVVRGTAQVTVGVAAGSPESVPSPGCARPSEGVQEKLGVVRRFPESMQRPLAPDLQLRELSVGQQVDIPLGAVHRLANRGPDPLEIVEVQFGSVLDEADIERLQDDYGRA